MLSRRFSILRPNPFVPGLFLAGLALVRGPGARGTPAGADWPMYRHDVRRSACTRTPLPQHLTLAWERRFPAFEPAFPFTARLHFDAAYQPVIAGKRLFLGSPVDGSVRAFDVAGGRQLWCFYANGPVRLAPVAAAGRILFGSDDGRFYCLEAATGKLCWRFRAFPKKRPDLHLLGNNRLISMWPVRGGPAAENGVVYFGSGMWPTMGVFIYALRIADGTVLWVNDRLNYIANLRLDHNQRAEAGLTPLGYFLLDDKRRRLVVATGRSQPAGLDAATGKLFYYVQGYRNGDCRLALGADYAFVGRRGVVSLVDFREVGSKWLMAGKDRPEGFDTRRMDEFEGPYHPYKFFPGCDAFSVFDGPYAYGFSRGVLYGYDLRRAGISEYEAHQGNYRLKPLRWDVPLVLRLPTRYSGKPARLFLKAGNRLYGAAGNTLVVFELAGAARQTARLVWSRRLSERPAAMAAGAGRLFVVLKNGRLLCFGAAAAKPKSPKHWNQSRTDHMKTTTRAPVSGTLGRILERLPQRSRAFAVIFGDSGALSAQLVRGSRLRILTVSATRAEADRLRAEFGARRWLGRRIDVFAGTPARFRLPPYLATLLILGPEAPAPERTVMARLWRAVHPYGGILACLGPKKRRARFAAVAESANLEQALVRRIPGAVWVQRLGALPGAADWTHESADAARTFFSPDRRVAPPLAPLWFGEGTGYGFYKVHDYGAGVKPQACAGRVVALQQFSGALVAYDAYTGLVQWKRRLLQRTPQWPWLRDGSYEWSWVAAGGRVLRYATMPDGVFVVDKGRCLILDPASGRTRRTLDLHRAIPALGDLVGRGVFVSGSAVLVPVSSVASDARGQPAADADALVCFDRKSGALRWTRRAARRFNVHAVALGRGRVFCTDSPSPVQADRSARRGQPPNTVVSQVLCLDAESGKRLWRRTLELPYRVYAAEAWISLRSRDDWLAYSTTHDLLLAGRENQTAALRGKDGALVWRRAGVGLQPVIVAGDTFMDQSARRFELATGKPVPGSPGFRRNGCNYAVAGERLTFVRDKTICYTDTRYGAVRHLRNIRSGCSASLVPACGLLNAPNFSQGCMCDYPVQTCSAWVRMDIPGIEKWAGSRPLVIRPVMKGPAIPMISPKKAAAMHAFYHRFMVSTKAEARKHLLGYWTFDAVNRSPEPFVPNAAGRDFPAILSSRSLAPGIRGLALDCAPARKVAATVPWKPLLRQVRDAVTVAAWVRLGPSQAKGAAGIFERSQYYRLMVANTTPPYQIQFNVQNAEHRWGTARSASIVPAGVWTHVAGTFDGETGELFLYIDGKRAGTGRLPPGSRIPPAKTSLSIGVRDRSAFLDGRVDEVRLYDRVLSPELVQALARDPAAASPKNPKK